MKKEYPSKRSFFGESMLFGVFALVYLDSWREGNLSGRKALAFICLGGFFAAFHYLLWESRRVSFVLDEDVLSYRVRKGPWIDIPFSKIKKVMFLGSGVRLMEIIHSGTSITLTLDSIDWLKFEKDVRERLGDKVRNPDGWWQDISSSS